jgi:excisionase family DNA binding protein
MLYIILVVIQYITAKPRWLHTGALRIKLSTEFNFFAKVKITNWPYFIKEVLLVSNERMTEKLLKAENAAPILDVKVRTLRVWTSDHKIPHIKIGHTVRYRLSDLMAWADARCVEAK